LLCPRNRFILCNDSRNDFAPCPRTVDRAISWTGSAALRRSFSAWRKSCYVFPYWYHLQFSQKSCEITGIGTDTPGGGGDPRVGVPMLPGRPRTTMELPQAPRNYQNYLGMSLAISKYRASGSARRLHAPRWHAACMATRVTIYGIAVPLHGSDGRLCAITREKRSKTVAFCNALQFAMVVPEWCVFRHLESIRFFLSGTISIKCRELQGKMAILRILIIYYIYILI
jgi:hypothetical protein